MMMFVVTKIEFYPEDPGCQTEFVYTLPKVFANEAKAFEYAKWMANEITPKNGEYITLEEGRSVTVNAKDCPDLGYEFRVEEFEFVQ